VATFVVARRRHDVSGRFGLRASPGGFATPAFGEGPETVRVAGTRLVREEAGVASTADIAGSTLRELATFADVDLAVSFSAGADTPALGDPDAALELDADAAAVVADWYDLGWRALDDVVGGLPAEAAPATIQLWPEHFDAGTNVALPSGARVNLGFSPGDGFEPAPYAYIGPWGPERPGDPDFWNAPFGAVLRASELRRAADPTAAAVAFLHAGLRALSS